MNFLIVCIEATLLELVWFVFLGTGFKLKTFLFPCFLYFFFICFPFCMYLRTFPLLMVKHIPVLEKYGRRGDKTIVNGCYSMLYVLKVICCISVDEAKSR